MINRFALLDGDGVPVAFYSDDVNAPKTIPADAKALTEQQYKMLRERKNGRVVGDQVIYPEEHPSTQMAAAKAALSEAVQAYVDKVARARDAGSGVLLASYVASTVPAWAADAASFVAWRDSVWLACYGLVGEVEAGQRVIEKAEDVIALLPSPPWPVA